MRDPSKVVDRLARQWGDRVRTLRSEHLQINQLAFAEMCGVTQQTISKIENGRMIPLDHLKVTIARNLGTSPARLFQWPSTEELWSLFDEEAA